MDAYATEARLAKAPFCADAANGLVRPHTVSASHLYRPRLLPLNHRRQNTLRVQGSLASPRGPQSASRTLAK